MGIRVSADHAGWAVREAAWGLEERVLWRGSDATRAALERAGRATDPLQRLIKTRLPGALLAQFRGRGANPRAAPPAPAATLAIAGAAPGAIIAADHGSTQLTAPPLAPLASAPQA